MTVSFVMDRSCRSLPAAAVLLAAAIPLAACNVDVRRHDANGKADVDVSTPVGNVSVRTNVETPETGMAVYPGARPLRDKDEPESADVNVGGSLFGVKVVAAKFESSDAQERIVDFYRKDLASFGEVTECRGNVDFRRDSSGARRPVCKEKLFEHELNLVAGTEEDQHIVAVKPRGDGTEFSLVHVQTRGKG